MHISNISRDIVCVLREEKQAVVHFEDFHVVYWTYKRSIHDIRVNYRNLGWRIETRHRDVTPTVKITCWLNNSKFAMFDFVNIFDSAELNPNSITFWNQKTDTQQVEDFRQLYDILIRELTFNNGFDNFINQLTALIFGFGNKCIS